jgi:homoserine kinase
MSFSVFAPGSSANLGPGFDCLGVALDLWLRADISPSENREIVDGGSPDLLGGENLVISAMRAAERELGLVLPGCTVYVESDIPVARGLGSSAAALVAGVQAACVLAGYERLTPQVLIDVAGAIEGHADNASAAALGGIAVAVPSDGRFVAAPLSGSIPWIPVFFIPDTASFTHDARAVLPPNVPMADAVANLGRAVLLGVALRHRREDLLREAMQDRLHQPYRAKLFPHLDPCIAAALGAGAVGACLSGAGPTMLALSPPQFVEQVSEALRCAAEQAGVPGRTRPLPVTPRGCYHQFATSV